LLLAHRYLPSNWLSIKRRRPRHRAWRVRRTSTSTCVEPRPS
jgi:hypothetical protein